MKKLPVFTDPKASERLRALCAERQITPELVEELVGVARSHAGSGRRTGVFEQVETVLDDYIERSGGGQ